jgi:hypothetical protein
MGLPEEDVRNIYSGAVMEWLGMGEAKPRGTRDERG